MWVLCSLACDGGQSIAEEEERCATTSGIMRSSLCTRRCSFRNPLMRVVLPNKSQDTVNKWCRRDGLFTHLLSSFVTRQPLVPIHHHVVPSIDVIPDGLRGSPWRMRYRFQICPTLK